MPRWLQRTNRPTFFLWIYMLVLGWATGISEDGELPRRAESIASILQPLIITWWVLVDAHRRGRALFLDYPTFVFLCWPVLVPVYLFQTRGAKAFLTLLCFAGISLTSAAIAFTFWMLR